MAGNGISRGWRAALAPCALCALLVAPALAQAASPGRRASAPGDEAGPFRNYRFLPDAPDLLAQWLACGFCERLELGTSAGGRELFAVQFGGKGPLPLAERTTVFLLGGLDGVSLSGSEAVLAVVDSLLAAPAELPANVTFVAVPWASPDGLARRLAEGAGDGRNDHGQDDDADGKVDEDGPDDLDGDGLLLQMLIEDPQGPWTWASDARFLRPARAGEAPRFQLSVEGKDDDHDGEFNEDPPGGIVTDLNFPVGWRGPWGGLSSGTWPLSEPESRALADLALKRRAAIVLVFQGNHGSIAAPGGLEAGSGRLELPFAGDESIFRGVTELFARTTGRNQEGTLRLAQARGEERPGAAIDWFYSALGALALEVGVWGPAVGRESDPTVDAEFPRADKGATPGGISARDRAWARWLDDTRGGIGFVEWQPVELGNSRRAWVGGWQAFTRLDPPPEMIPRVVRGVDAFVHELVLGLPSLDIEVLEASRQGRVCLVRARIANQGWLPSGVGPTSAPIGLRLALDLPEGVSLLAGEPVRELGNLPGRGTSAVFEWLLVAPEETVLRLSLTGAWMPPVVREVRL